METIADDFLGGKIKLLQPSYKATSDAVLLASTVEMKEGKLLDVGSGNGVISIITTFNNKNVDVSGIEIKPEEIEVSKKNALFNQVKVRFIKADIKDNPLKDETFDHVITNPPYFKGSTLSKMGGKETAHHEGNVLLNEWLDFCIRRVTHFGYLSLIIDIARVPEVITSLNGKCGKIIIFPLHPKAGLPAKRAIIKARKGSKEPFAISCGLFLHETGGKFTKEAEKILRNGDILKL